MRNYEIAVVDRTTAFLGDNRAVQHCVRGDTITVEFDTEWNDVERCVANFVNRADGTRKTIEMRKSEPLLIPWECLRTQGELYVTFIGYVGDFTSKGIRIITKDMEYPFVVEHSTALELVVPEATEDILFTLLNAFDNISDVMDRAILAAVRAEEAAKQIGTSTVSKSQYDKDINTLAGVLANYMGRLWYMNGVIYSPPEYAVVEGDTLYVVGYYDPDTKTIWIGDVD